LIYVRRGKQLILVHTEVPEELSREGVDALQIPKRLPMAM
jgi:predicted GNAT family acetyltransferase